jgi:hypothetical protein
MHPSKKAVRWMRREERRFLLSFFEAQRDACVGTVEEGGGGGGGLLVFPSKET